MLPARHRLTDRADFRSAGRGPGGSRSGGPLLVIQRRRGRPDTAARVGFVVARSVGNAVVRNRVRRRLRHIAARHLALVGPGHEVVIRALPASASATSTQLEHEVTRLLAAAVQRAGRRTGR